MPDYIRICPVCDIENPPERVHCSSCGTLLAGVDFSLPRQPLPEERAAPLTSSLPEIISEPGDPIGPAPMAPVPASLFPEVLPVGGPRICPDPDCGQPNPAGSERCLYCNSPLPALVPSSLAPETEEAPATGGEEAGTLRLDPAGVDLPHLPVFASPSLTRINLPMVLAAKYNIVSELKVAGSEADLLVVEPISGGEALVAKLYRRGMRPDSLLLARLAEAGSHVVKLHGHGVADGVAWELMEYCRAGSLREVLQRGLLTREILHGLVAQLAAGLAEVHAMHILHRDLKPENVLVRSLNPLQLALTDFGIASLSDATQHFTDGARTVKYAAPEALTGVLDPKTDWWSVGMILLEAASGRHPFDGLSEQVINHHLATRPVEVSGVADDDFAKLCRGLLLRDPARRWGAAEVGRWLRGDGSLVVPQDASLTAARAYRIGGREARTGEELALALVANWDEGRQDLQRGMLGEWVRGELHDLPLTRRLADIMESRDEGDDRRLLRFLLAAAPTLPPVWQGRPAHREAIIAQARLTLVDGDVGSDARRWLDSLFAEGGLVLFARQGDGELEVLDRQWRSDLAGCQSLWEQARQAYRAWKNRPRGVAGNDNARVVNFDAVVFGRETGLAFGERADWHGGLLLARADGDYAAAVDQEVTLAWAELTEDCPWFARIAGLVAEPGVAEPVPLVTAYRLLALARVAAGEERAGRQAAQRARGLAITQLRQEVLTTLAPLQASWEHPDRFARREINGALGRFQEFSVRILAMDYSEEAFVTLHRQVSSLQRQAFTLGQALDQLEHVESANAIVFDQNRIGLAAGVLFMMVVLGGPWLAVLAGLGVAGFFGWRWQQRQKARAAVATQLLMFRRQAAQLAGKAEQESALPRRTREA